MKRVSEVETPRDPQNIIRFQYRLETRRDDEDSGIGIIVIHSD